MRKSLTDFDEEMFYQITMHVVRMMCSSGLINKSDYHEIETIFLEKYQPKCGKIHAALPLI